MQHWITEFMGQFGYISIFLLITLENVFPPIPSEVVLTFGGYMTTNTNLTIPGVVVFSTAGSVVGAVILYRLGCMLGIRRLEKIITRWGHILRVKVKDVHRAGSWFKRYSYWAVFLCRMVPLIRSLISIPAGISKMKFSSFILYTTAGTLIWNTLLVCAGALLGNSWDKVVKFMDIYSKIIYIILGLIGVGIIILFIRKGQKPSPKVKD